MGAVRDALEAALVDARAVAEEHGVTNPTVEMLNAALAGPDPEETVTGLTVELDLVIGESERRAQRITALEEARNQLTDALAAQTFRATTRIYDLEAERDAALARVTTPERMTVEHHGEIDRLRALLARVRLYEKILDGAGHIAWRCVLCQAHAPSVREIVHRANYLQISGPCPAPEIAALREGT